MDAQAVVTEIERFSLYDGPGIRTTVFVKGCPLHCAWCHNPECIARPVQLGYRESRCVLCGRCAVACPKGAHTVGLGEHQVDRALCDGCGACVRACPQGALTLFGRRMTAGRRCASCSGMRATMRKAAAADRLRRRAAVQPGLYRRAADPGAGAGDSHRGGDERRRARGGAGARHPP